MRLHEAKLRAREVFPGLASGGSGNLTAIRYGEHLTPPGFPLADLLLFGFRDLLDVEVAGPVEKLRWALRFTFKGSTFAFQHQKFGLRMFCADEDRGAPLAAEVLGRARELVTVVEAYLREYGTSRIKEGYVTVENLYGQLDFRYGFLRQQAQNAYAAAPPSRESRLANDEASRSWYPGKPEQEGGALATAAVDAYFSRLEHLFTLAGGFIDGVIRHDGVLDFLASNWPTKAKAVLDLANDATAKRLYDRLYDLRQEWRNPLAHGGFLSNGASLFFHVPRLAAVPAQLTRTPEGPRLGFRLREDTFSEIAKAFDEFDSYLAEGPLRYVVMWAESGLDVALDESSRERYRGAMESEEAFDNLIQATAYQDDVHRNMDY